MMNQPLPTTQEKRDHAKMHLTDEAVNAMVEMSAWEWDE